ncbi:hypothetical protein H4R19_000221 [Coemansia spiralis]|nr:hypothetical protein H4R19_000221 [Coemansia spiralis]
MALVGRWFTIDGEGGIVRYVGPVAGGSGEWLGVEWESAGRGKHDGSRDGRRYFTCRFPQHQDSSGGGSFIRPVARIDWGQPLMAAVRDRYIADGPAGLELATGNIDGRRGRIEAVGMEQVAAAQADLRSLRVVGAECRRVFGTDAPLDELASVQTLLLCGNFITSWAQAEGILSALPERRLELLDLSDNHLEDMSICSTTVQTAVDTLRLDGAPLVGWEGAQAAAEACAVRALSLSRCALGDPAGDFGGWRQLGELRVCGNQLTSILPFGHLPALEVLDASGNPGLCAIPPVPAGSFPRLHTLNIGRTAIANWASIDALCGIPTLRALVAAHTPLADGDPHPRTQLVARLPHVATVDRSIVAPAERTELERHYLSLCAAATAAAGATGDALVPAMAERFPRIAVLVAAHGAPRVAPVESRLRARLAETAIEIARGIGPDDAPLAVHTRPLIRTMLVRQLRALAARLAGQRPGPVALYLRSDSAGAAWTPMDTDARPLAFYGLDAGCTVRAVIGSRDQT